MIPPKSPLRIGLYQNGGRRQPGDDPHYDLTRSLLDRGYAVSVIRSDSQVGAMQEGAWLLLGVFGKNEPLPAMGNGNGDKLYFRDIDGLETSEILKVVEEVRGQTELPDPGGWKPWFPVIDYNRCTNCMQCLSFCLFDVYGVHEEKIQVQNESNCKTDCPACSRVCPEVAILFPKYKSGPINGDVVRQEDIQREAMKVDISALLGGDLYGSLRTRQTEARQRFSTERDESRALLERKKCLRKLKKDFDIPDEVLMSLPSAGDIQERAERAKAKLAARQERSQTVKDNRPAPTEDDWGI
ncbi:MAG: ferredoxin family protein [Acidobacteria bacterium]|nr:ferredoxin family protein [Acidobacteriota bacterium]